MKSPGSGQWVMVTPVKAVRWRGGRDQMPHAGTARDAQARVKRGVAVTPGPFGMIKAEKRRKSHLTA